MEYLVQSIVLIDKINTILYLPLENFNVVLNANDSCFGQIKNFNEEAFLLDMRSFDWQFLLKSSSDIGEIAHPVFSPNSGHRWGKSEVSANWKCPSFGEFCNESLKFEKKLEFLYLKGAKV